MNLRQGSSGILEGVSITAVSLSTAGVFALESDQLYGGGNTAYYTLPAALLLSLGLFSLLAKLAERSGASDLSGLIIQSDGRPTGLLVSLLLCCLLVFSACLPLSRFINALHGLFYSGVSYSSILLFVISPVLLLCMLGLEPIARTAKLFSALLVLVLIGVIVSAASEFETYRLYPLFGGGAASIIVRILRETGVFMPPLLALLITADGFRGVHCAKRIGIASALVSAVICVAAHLTIGLSHTFVQLGETYMPLFKLNHLSLFEAHLMRLDKLANVIWLNGAVLSAAFCLYAAARLFAKTFGLHDVRPAAASAAAIEALLILIGAETKLGGLADKLRETVFRYGAAFVFPLLACCLASAVRSERRKRCEKA